jgi:KDO2-lipid IV(A) lauroyltransferase
MTMLDLRHRVEYAVVMAVREVIRVLPDAGVRGLGSLIGGAFYWLDGGHRRLAVAQLHQAFSTKSMRECRDTARAMFGHFGRLLVILLKFSTLTPAQMRARVEYDGEDRVRTALAEGKGVLLFSGHFGFWELQGIAHPFALPPMSVLARPLDNPYLQGLLERVRTGTGNGVIYRKGAVRRTLRALQANGTVAVMIDQHISGGDALTVEFFGRPAATTSALAALALRTGAPVIPVFALPLPNGRFRMVYEHPVVPPPEDTPNRALEFTQRCTDVLEMYVRRRPDLWLWMHRRWRADEPSGEAPDSSRLDNDDESDEIDT